MVIQDRVLGKVSGMDILVSMSCFREKGISQEPWTKDQTS